MTTAAPKVTTQSLRAPLCTNMINQRFSFLQSVIQHFWLLKEKETKKNH